MPTTDPSSATPAVSPAPKLRDEPLWRPTEADVARANLTRFVAFLRDSPEGGFEVPADYHALWRWSVEQPERFWAAMWHFAGIVADEDPDGAAWDEVLVGAQRMAPPDPELGPRWFTGARLNFAENLLRHRGDHPAIVAWTEAGRQGALSFDELRAEVARVAAGLRDAGVGVGDRVGAFMPNVPETVIAMLATASLGAVWSSCSPDFGAQGVLDRFGQIAPKVLVAADAYRFAGREFDCLPRVREIVARIPSIERVLVVSSGTPDLAGLPGAVRWRDFGTPGAPLSFARLPFDHPLYVMYSSGTTGLPKCMVHSAGGTLLQHHKELGLHTDLGPEDRVFYFTTCGWMMWNWLVSALAVGSTIVLYDGAPLAPRPEVLWDMAAAERVTVFGTSAKYLALLQKAGVVPRESHDVSALRAILSTGSPLADHGYDFVYEHIKPDVRLSSISGGTDIISCFAGGVPTLPVWRGELQARALAMAVEVLDEAGDPLRGVPGELVCTRPFPSMPVAFWNDPDGAKYRAAYFETYPNTWRHGDWAEITSHDGMIIHGRSDATLNPGGVRIGTAEIYRQVEQIDEVVESVVVEQTLQSDAGATSRIVLFVRLREGRALDGELQERIRQRIRDGTSPHHVPRVIVAVTDIPRTISGKITELAVREVIHGRPVKNVDALANPGALELFRNLPQLQV